MFTLRIETDNDAFQEPNTAIEIARILRRLADNVASGALYGSGPGYLRDENGNRVGSWEYTP